MKLTGQQCVRYETNTNAGGVCGNGLIGPARRFFILRERKALSASEPPLPLPDGDHYREIAGRVRELARFTRSPAIRKELPISRAATTILIAGHARKF